MVRQLFQVLRCRSTGEQVKVDVQKGPTPSEAFVLWSDVQSVFPGTRSIRNGEFGVPFMKDRDYDL